MYLLSDWGGPRKLYAAINSFCIRGRVLLMLLGSLFLYFSVTMARTNI